LDQVTSTLELDTRRGDVSQLELLHVSNTPTQHLQYKNMELKDKDWFVRLENFSTKFFKFVVCNPCQSSPSFTILVSLWFIIISLVFFYLYKLSFLGFLQFKGSFVCGQTNSKIP